MKILFCDLCNESVPQGDLDDGLAFMRKGRVICAKCDAIMSHPEETAQSAGPFGAPKSESGSPGEAGKTESPKPVPETSGPRPSVVAAASGASPVHLRPQKSGGTAGIVVGLFAILLTALAAGFFYDQQQEMRKELEARLDKVRDDTRADGHRAELDQRELGQKLDGLAVRIEGQLSGLRSSVESGLSGAQGKASDTLAKVESFAADLTDMRETVGLIKRHDQELMSLQQKFSQLSAEIGALSSSIAQLEQGQRAAARIETPQPNSEPQAAWIGLLKQLESPNSGDRWTAVQALGETRDPAVAEYLLPLLKDADIFVRMATARVLGDLSSKSSIGGLIDALEDPEAPVREAAYVALMAVSKRNLPFDPMADPADRAKRVKAWRDWWEKEGA
jgi:uncharacterized protein YlxW (UPF0749 family)